MQRLTRIALLGALPLLLLPLPAQETGETGWTELQKCLKGRELVLRPTIEGRRKVYISVGGEDETEAFALHRSNRLFPMRVAEPVRIVGVRPWEDHLELELRSEWVGNQRIRLREPRPRGCSPATRCLLSSGTMTCEG